MDVNANNGNEWSSIKNVSLSNRGHKLVYWIWIAYSGLPVLIKQFSKNLK